MKGPDMNTLTTPAPVFGFLAQDHPFAERLLAFGDRLTEQVAPSGARCQVSSEVKGRRAVHVEHPVLVGSHRRAVGAVSRRAVPPPPPGIPQWHAL